MNAAAHGGLQKNVARELNPVYDPGSKVNPLCRGIGRSMRRRTSYFAAAAFLLTLPTARSYAQTETYRFDGVADSDPQPADTTDWFISQNWGEGGFDPIEPLIPDLDTRVEIQTSTLGVNAPEIRAGEAKAHQVRIGRTGGVGLMKMTGGSLELKQVVGFGNRFRVGSDDPEDPGLPVEQRNSGTFNMSGGTLTVPSLWIGSGSHGEMNLSGGTVAVRENLYMDWSFDAHSVLNMTGGTVNIAGVLRMFRNSTINLDGGDLHITGTAELGTTDEVQTQTPDISMTITDGLMEAGGFLKVNGSVVLDGGILRAANFQEALSTGTVEVNEGGVLQLRNSQESVAAVMSLVSGGFITTSSPLGTSALQISVVNVAGTDFTQVTLPESGLQGDFDMDNDVDGQDFLVWQRQLGGNLDASDLADWKAGFGTMNQVAPLTQTPEPSSALLGLSAGAVLAAGRRGRACFGRFKRRQT
jgi:hypothetical protein